MEPDATEFVEAGRSVVAAVPGPGADGGREGARDPRMAGDVHMRGADWEWRMEAGTEVADLSEEDDTRGEPFRDVTSISGGFEALPEGGGELAL